MNLKDCMHKIDESLSLSEDVINSALSVFADYYGVEMTPEQCVEVVKTSKILAADLYASGSARDTCTREYLIDALVQKIMGKGYHWPCYGDGEEKARKFFVDFGAAVRKAGYGVCE